jgi:ankyrin repeat protein
LVKIHNPFYLESEYESDCESQISNTIYYENSANDLNLPPLHIPVEKTYSGVFFEKLLKYAQSPQIDENTFMNSFYEEYPYFQHDKLRNRVDFPVDDEFNTLLHWATSLGLIELSKTLLRLNASTLQKNIYGETCLIKSIMYPHNYANRTFDRILSMLDSTIFMKDLYDRTILHHLFLLPDLWDDKNIDWNGKEDQVVLYYLKSIVSVLVNSESKSLLKFLNLRDYQGNTALFYAMQLGDINCIKILLLMGSDPTIMNHTGRNCLLYVKSKAKLTEIIPFLSSTDVKPQNQLNLVDGTISKGFK